LGGDPEFFLAAENGTYVPSEELIPPVGLKVGGHTAFTKDGVQAEYHLRHSHCRAFVGDYGVPDFRQFRRHLEEKNLKAVLKSRIVIPPQQLRQLSPDCLLSGCSPSLHYKDQDTTRLSALNPLEDGRRWGGGHLVLGIHNQDTRFRDPLGQTTGRRKAFQPDLLVDVADRVVGNTLTLVDRDPYVGERRQFYGCAGEYRLPPYGFEYRTLSNFWFLSFPLFGLASSLLRWAYMIYCVPEISNEFLTLTKREDIVDAINTNDPELARKNWNKMKEFLLEGPASQTVNSLVPGHDGDLFPITKATEANFERFLLKKPTDWFGEDFVANWITGAGKGHTGGWEDFLKTC
jgi:hypothetical protein